MNTMNASLSIRFGSLAMWSSQVRSSRRLTPDGRASQGCVSDQRRMRRSSMAIPGSKGSSVLRTANRRVRSHARRAGHSNAVIDLHGTLRSFAVSTLVKAPVKARVRKHAAICATGSWSGRGTGSGGVSMCSDPAWTRSVPLV